MHLWKILIYSIIYRTKNVMMVYESKYVLYNPGG